MTLSLCMIVRDEAEWIAGCLLHHRALADELVVLDTGSLDGTPELARAAGARVSVLPWPDDFAAARNAAIEAAAGDWVLTLDPDEWIAPEDFAEIRALAERGGAAGYRLRLRTYTNDSELFDWTPLAGPVPDVVTAWGFTGYCEHALVRLFPRHPGIRYRGRIHETVEAALAEQGFDYRTTDIVVHHLGHARPAPAHRDKTRCYLELSRLKAAEHPRDAQAHLEHGMAALESGHPMAAVAAFAQAVALAPARRACHEHLGAALLRSGRHAEALAAFAEALDVFPRTASLYAGAGEAVLALGHPSEARAVLAHCLTLDPRHFRARLNLGVLEMDRDPAAARRHLEDAERINPRSDLPPLNLGLLHARAGDRAAARAALERALGLNAGRWQTLAALGALCFDANDFDGAVVWYARAAAVPDHGPEVEAKQCAAEVARGNLAQARERARAAARRDRRYAHLEELCAEADSP
jgi:tetratricopeptide (TPR) repeat protein